MSQDNVTHLNRDVRFEARPTLHVGSRTPMPQASAPHKKFVAKGHDAQLMDAQMNHLPVSLTTVSGTTIAGTISKRDKYTITIRSEAGQDEIFYKHAIESVLIGSKEAGRA